MLLTTCKQSQYVVKDKSKCEDLLTMVCNLHTFII